jgi:release factor glutamine methyltransferase
MEATDPNRLINAIRRLAYAGVDTPNLDAGLILCKVLGCTKTELFAHPDRKLDASQEAEFETLITRREAREPLPYVLGEWEFMGHRYEVSPQALIPRPETELLVEAVVAWFGGPAGLDTKGTGPIEVSGSHLDAGFKLYFLGSNRQRGQDLDPPPLLWREPDTAAGCDSGLPSPRGRGAGGEARGPLQVLEVGTGTGCIAIELALRLTEARVTSIDVSTEALELASRNVARFELSERVDLRHAEFPNNISGLGPFDAVVSNPPYVATAEVEVLEPELTRYEPRAALDGGTDGLDVIRALVSESRRLLKPKGLLAMEIGHNQAESVVALLREAGWNDIEVIPDLSRIQRFAMAKA